MGLVRGLGLWYMQMCTHLEDSRTRFERVRMLGKHLPFRFQSAHEDAYAAPFLTLLHLNENSNIVLFVKLSGTTAFTSLEEVQVPLTKL